MKTHVRIAVALLLICTSAYADDPASIQQGASQYDWHICFDKKMDACKLACSSSDDVGCQSDCEDIAADKCKSEGLQAPEYD